MGYQFNIKKFADDVQAKRQSIQVRTSIRMPEGVTTTTKAMSLRAAAEGIGVSATTLMRVERGFLPDVHTVAKLCSWMKKSPNTYFDGKLNTKKK